jgi:hypothetical protein
VIRVERTGTVPFPVVIEVRSMKGAPARVELSGDNATDSVQVALAGPVRNVRLDPDGLLPMWSSSNVEMRRTFLRAMGTAGPAEPFIDLAESHLANDPDPLVAAIAIERSFELGRFTQIQRLARTLPFVTRCDDRVTCLAAIQVARALNRIGANGQARALLRSLDAMVTPFGPAASRRLATAHAEVESVERR